MNLVAGSCFAANEYESGSIQRDLTNHLELLPVNNSQIDQIDFVEVKHPASVV
jgi:hypothetical protein